MRLFPGWALRGFGFLALAASLGATGCGNPTGTVTGKVTYQGKVVKGGTVLFAFDGKPDQIAQISEDGSYKFDKLPLGPVKIAVNTEKLNPKRRSNIPDYKPPPGVQAPGGYTPPDRGSLAQHYVPIPLHYANLNESGLTYTVKSGSQEHDIPLE